MSPVRTSDQAPDELRRRPSDIGGRFVRLASALAAAGTMIAHPTIACAEATPLSATVQGRNRSLVTAFAGFPFLEVELTHGMGRSFEAGLQARSAWSNMQRLGVVSKLELGRSGPGRTALRVAVDGALARASARWLALTGEQELDGSADWLYSWISPARRVMTVDVGYHLIATTHPPAAPLSGGERGLAFGSNLELALAAELPQPAGLVLSFEAGLVVHLSAFDDALVMPVVAAGISQAL